MSPRQLLQQAHALRHSAALGVTLAPEREPEQQLAERVRAEHARSVLVLVLVLEL